MYREDETFGWRLLAALATGLCALHTLNAADSPATPESPVPQHATNSQLAEAERLDNEAHAQIRAFQIRQAIPPAQQALQLREVVLGPDHPDVASSLITLAGLLNRTNQYNEAVPLYRRALAIRERLLGPDHIEISYLLGEFARVLESAGQYSEAESLQRRALAIKEKVLSPDKGDIALNLRDLVLRLEETGRFSEADRLEAQALAISTDPWQLKSDLPARSIPEPAPAQLSRDRSTEATTPISSNPQLAEAAQLDMEVRAHYRDGEYAEAVPKAERALHLRETVLGPDHPDVAASLDYLAELLDHTARGEEAESLYRRAVDIRNGHLGADHFRWAHLDAERAQLELSGLYDEATTIAQQALRAAELTEGPDHPDVARSALNLATLYQEKAEYTEAEPLFKRSIAINEKVFGPDGLYVAESLDKLASLYGQQARYAEAEPLLNRSLAITELRFGPDNRLLPASLSSLATLYSMEGRYSLAEPLLRRSLAMREKFLLGPDSPDVAESLNSLASFYVSLGRYSEAEPLYRRALVSYQRLAGPHAPVVGTILRNVAVLYRQEGRYAQAASLLERSVAIYENVLGSEHPAAADSLLNLAFVYQQQARYAQAEPLLKRALAIDEKVLGQNRPQTAFARESLGRNDALRGNFAEAAANLRLACAALASIGRSADPSGSGTQPQRTEGNACWNLLSLALWGWSTQRDKAPTPDGPESLKLEAFTAIQRAVQSAAGDAMARSAALRVANSAAVGPAAQAYEDALLQKESLDQEFAKAAGESGEKGSEKRRALARARDQAVSKVDQLSQELRAQAPRYWDYRSPEPVSIPALQARTGADAVLLHENEALIVCLVAPGNAKGLVMALNKEQIAWAQIPLTGDEIKSRIIKLRAQIDPEAYALRGLTVVQNGGSDAGSRPGAFDRQAAYELYQALLGDASIQAVLKDKPVLLFVPSGPLTSLPPALLVTAPPPDGSAGDADPSSLRATAWLLRSKALALLPTVSSLKTLRQILPSAVNTSDPLLAFADPDFRRSATPPKTVLASAAARGFSTYFRDGLPLAEALDDLPPLPGTRIEGEALERALQGRPGSLLTGKAASKAELMARNADGRLAKVRVLEFATHGLVAGDASDLAEPALVLAAGVKPEDELLLASEATTLKLNANWVLLSACNTASPDAPEAQGLSGLSRAFFYAGARSLLVSHWRVRDDVAPRLIPAMLLAERKNPAISRADALRQATLAVLDDQNLNAANPSAWAPFTLVGEAAR